MRKRDFISRSFLKFLLITTLIISTSEYLNVYFPTFLLCYFPGDCPLLSFLKIWKFGKKFQYLQPKQVINKMTRTLNISLNVPDSYGIEELTRQLTEYGERLISRRNRVQKSKKRRSQTFLKGLSLPDGSTDKELIEEYISEKYGV